MTTHTEKLNNNDDEEKKLNIIWNRTYYINYK
jgi:hypothetical protein